MRWIDTSLHHIRCLRSRGGVKSTRRPTAWFVKAQVARRRKGKATAHGR